jgi:steroid delta-isomerase-like uncharacterized protein
MSENLRLLGKYSDAMAGGDEQAVYEFFAEDFSSHVTPRVNPAAVGTDIRGSEGQWWRETRDAFPDMVFSVNLLIEADDLIVSNWTVQGTHTGKAFNGVPASGEPVTINGTAILRMRDGKIVEHWGGPQLPRRCRADALTRPREVTGPTGRGRRGVRIATPRGAGRAPRMHSARHRPPCAAPVRPRRRGARRG